MTMDFDWLDTLVGLWVGAAFGAIALAIVRMGWD